MKSQLNFSQSASVQLGRNVKSASKPRPAFTPFDPRGRFEVVVNSNSVNVGDINVNGTANPDDTARRVVSQIRREFRRGTSSRL